MDIFTSDMKNKKYDRYGFNSSSIKKVILETQVFLKENVLQQLNHYDLKR